MPRAILKAASPAVTACMFSLLLAACAGPSNPPIAARSADMASPAIAPANAALAQIVTGLPGGSSLANTVMQVADGTATAQAGNVAAPSRGIPMTLNFPVDLNIGETAVVAFNTLAP